MKEITTDNYDFERLRKGNVLYVDKTQYVWKLVSSETTVYFLSRPRRFGKSLLLSTLKAYFLGKRQLFKGLAIERLAPAEWEEWPVIHLDMALASSHGGLDETKKALDFYMGRVAGNLGMTVKDGMTATSIFQSMVDFMYEKHGGKQVVVLIDEYDKPILDALHTSYVGDVVGIMQGFYQVVKSNVEKERFVFITGVSKFSHTSLFSGMNNLTDITQDTAYATMLGYTEQEFRDNFSGYIDMASEKLDMTREAFIEKMKQWYDGFRFTSDSSHVFNPVSVGMFFQSYQFRNYWYATGTPTFLVEQMRHDPFRMDEYTKEWVEPQTFDKFDAQHLDGFTLAVQTGYLTIREVEHDEFGMSYRYDFPNEEIRRSWYSDMLWTASAGQIVLTRQRRNLLIAFRDGNTQEIMQRLQWMFAGVTKENIGKVNEGYY